ncbi:MAG TPA: hypothetical protein VMI31_17635 [Fimbriimonadaceae bacterium]|nr:hypothetical protein [Fimbriimonadaceae bacterium]
MAVLSCVALAAAQGGGGGGGQGRRGGGRGGFGESEMTLANRADVQKELNITDDQKTKIQALQQQERQNMQGGGGNNGGTRPTMEEMQQRMAQMRAQQHKDLATVLNDGQMKRLGELLLQREGINAIAQPDVQTALGLSDDQKAKIKDLQQKEGEARQALVEKMRNQEITQEEFQSDMQKNQDTMKDELTKILTSDQAAKFKTMQGAPFTFDPNIRGGGFGGGGRRGGGGGGGNGGGGGGGNGGGGGGN